MQPLSPEDQAALDAHLKQAARILKQYTEPEKLRDFESIEVELRSQMVNLVNPTIAEFFSLQTARQGQQKPPASL